MPPRDLVNRLLRDRVRVFYLCLASLVIVVSTTWFFTATDQRGHTARLAADAPYYYAYLPSLVLDRDLDFTNEYRITKNWYRFGKTRKGRVANVFGVGNAVFELPWFATGHAVARVRGDKANGFSTAEVRATLFASLCFSLGALLFAFRFLRRRLGGDYLPALIPLVLACAGPVVYYAIRQPGYAHPFATFWIAWFVDAWDASYERPGPRSMKTWLGLGALLGAAALARPQLALWAVILVWAVADDAGRVRAEHDGRTGWLTEALRTLAPRWLAGAAVSVVFMVPQFLAWKALYGSFYVLPQGDGFMWWTSPAWSEVLFSSRNGLFPWAPLYAFAALGLLYAVRRVPRVGVALILGVALQAVANGAAWDWWAGGSFGGRRFDSCFVAFAFGLGIILLPKRAAAEPPRRRAIRIAWIGLAGVLSLTLALGNLFYTAASSSPTVRIYGGTAAWKILKEPAPAGVGAVVAVASRLANLPARAVFAARYGAALDAYDSVVGVHLLGELYPGLNSFRGKRFQRVKLSSTASPFLRGIARSDKPSSGRLSGHHATVFLPFNRRGPVGFTLAASSGQPGTKAEVVMRFNGKEIARQFVMSKPARLTAKVPRVRRGMNVLMISAPVGTYVYWLDVRTSANALGATQ